MRGKVLILKNQKEAGSEKGKPAGRRGRKAAGPYVVGRAARAGRLEAVVARLFLGKHFAHWALVHNGKCCRAKLCRSKEAAA
jgi:hypothetical protein